jgi:hypothetical protein
MKRFSRRPAPSALLVILAPGLCATTACQAEVIDVLGVPDGGGGADATKPGRRDAGTEAGRGDAIDTDATKPGRRDAGTEAGDASTCAQGDAAAMECDGSVPGEDAGEPCVAGGPNCAGTCLGNRCLVQISSANDKVWGVAANSSTIYWSGFTSGILKAPLEGGQTSTLLALPADEVNDLIFDLALNGTSLFATDNDSGNILQVPLQGGLATTLVSGRTSPLQITVDATSVYWTEVGTSHVDPSGNVMKASLAGGEPVTLATGQGDAWDIAVDGTFVYWATYDAILKVPIAGGTPTTLIAEDGWKIAQGFALRESNLYWLGGEEGAVQSLSVGGGIPTTLGSGGSSQGPNPVAVDSTSVYTFPDRALTQTPIGGGTTVTLISANSQNVGHDIVIAGDSLVWSDWYGLWKLTPR